MNSPLNPARLYPSLPAPASGKSKPKPLRICIASYDLVGPVRNGGVGTACTSLAEALAEAGHQVTLLYMSGRFCENRTLEYWVEDYRKKGIRFVPLPEFTSPRIEASFHMARAYEAYQWFLQEPFDVIHFPEWRAAGYYTILAKHQGLAFATTRLVVTTHGPTLWSRLSNGEYLTDLADLEIDFMERASVRWADAVVSPSHYLFDWMKGQGWVLPENCFVQQNIMPSTACRSLAGVPEERTALKELVFFGRLEARKGIALFCDALERLRSEPEMKHLTVTFLGKTSQIEGRDAADYLTERAAAWSWKWQIISDRDQPAAMVYLQEPGRLAVIPSRVDNLPYTVLECLGAGIPFLASNVGGIPEMIAPEDVEATCFPLRAPLCAQKILQAVRAGVRPVKLAIPLEATRGGWLAWHQTLAADRQPALSLQLESTLPLVSLCMSHFNRPDYLRQALASIEAQDYPNLELVLVDDASTNPEALALLDELAPKFAARQWQLIRNQEELFVGAARNLAARHARGEYLLFMDDDNVAKPHEVSTFIKVAHHTRADIVSCCLDFFSGKEPPSGQARYRFLFLGPAVSAGALRNYFGDTNSLIRRDVFLALGGFHEERGVGHEDWELCGDAILKGYHLEVAPEALVWYRRNQSELSATRTNSLHAGHMRNIRPYLDAVPPELRHLVLFAQGQLFRKSETASAAEGVSAYAQLTINWRSKFEAGCALAKLQQPEAAVQLMLEGIKAIESSRNPRVILEALLETGRQLVFLDPERSRHLLQLALTLAENLRHVPAQERAKALLKNFQPSPTGGIEPAAPSTAASMPPVKIHAPAEKEPSRGPGSSKPGTAPRVSIIIPTFDNLGLTQQCLQALSETTDVGACEIIVVDNASTDGTARFLEAEQAAGRLQFLRNETNLGFARGSNVGARAARGRWLVFLNNDTRPQPGWLEAMLRCTQDPQIGVVGAKLLYPDGKIQHAGIAFLNGVPDHPHRFAPADTLEVCERRDFDMVTGACLLISRSIFLELQGFDEVYQNGVEDVDLCLRVRDAGLKVVYQPEAVVYHHEGQSAGRFQHVQENLKLFLARWQGRFDGEHRLIPRSPSFVRPSEKSLLSEPPGVASSIMDASPVRVAWEGSFLDLGSLSHVNRELTRQLERHSAIQLSRVGRNILPARLARMSGLQTLASQLEAQPPRPAQITVRHAWPPDWKAPETGAWVLIQPWEFGALPQEWVRHLRQVDQVWAPTDYVRRVYVESGVDPAKVKVVPNGIDPERFHPQVKPLELKTRKSFKFLFVGGTIHRKGPDVLLKAYLENFTSADDVCLVIKDFGGDSVYAGQTLAKHIKAAQARPNAAEILYLTEELSPEELPGLYTACDCFAHPYRGEGFGLPVLEAMACGLPVIVTGGGATDDFAREEYVWRLASTQEPIGHEIAGLKLAKVGWLLEPAALELGARMRSIFQEPAEARAKARLASEYARREWTWERAAGIAAAHLRELAGKKPVAAIVPPPPVRKMELPAVAKIGELKEARELLRQNKLRPAWDSAVGAWQARPFHPEALLLLAEIYRVAGDFAHARRCAEQARRIAPQWKASAKFLKSLPGKGPLTPRQHQDAPNAGLPALPELPSSPRLTVCLIAKNEEQLLEQCLASVRSVAHQIVVVDTGSTDRTVEIARRHGAEVYATEWKDDFSAARNAALEHATGDWVLILDADEELTDPASLLKELRCSAIMAYRLPIMDAGKEGQGCNYVPRLFRNAPGLFFTGRIHEQIFPSLESCRAVWGLENRLGTATLRHHGYSAERVRDRQKIARNLRLLELAVEESEEDANLIMNLGLELVRDGQLNPGLDRYRQAFRLLSTQTAVVPELRETLLTQFSTHLLTSKEFGEIVEVLQSPLARAGGLTASLHYTLGLACMELRQFDAGAEQMRQCMNKRKQRALTPVNTEIQTSAPLHCLAICSQASGRLEAAHLAFKSALSEKPPSWRLQTDYARFLWAQGQPVEALKLLHQCVSEKADQPEVWRLGAELALSQPDLFAFACDWTGEALKCLPGDSVLRWHRAEALLLSKQAVQALALLDGPPAPDDAAGWSRRAICEWLADSPATPVPPEIESEASKEFLKWYRHLLQIGAEELVQGMHLKLDVFSRILPTAAAVLEAAMAEAGATPAAA